MKQHTESYDLPRDFAVIVDMYVQNHKVIEEKSELLTFWQHALDARQKYPELEEPIAEWALSCSATSPLINDQGILDQIHGLFGELEVSHPDNNVRWDKLQSLIIKARKD